MCPESKNLYIIEDLRSILDRLNTERVRQNKTRIDPKEWAKYMSKISSNKVRQLWITNMLRGIPIPHSKAIALRVGLDNVAKELKISSIPESVIAEKKRHEVE